MGNLFSGLDFLERKKGGRLLTKGVIQGALIQEEIHLIKGKLKSNLLMISDKIECPTHMKQVFNHT
jgi:hypothetical protein